MAHKCNLAVLDVFKKYVKTREGFKRVKKIIRHFSKSAHSKRQLIEATGICPKKFCPTRWGEWIETLAVFFQQEQAILTVNWMYMTMETLLITDRAQQHEA